MHELALCQSLLAEVTRVAHDHRAVAVESVTVDVGALGGVEPELLARAFTIARAGTVAASATLDIRAVAPRVRCRSCGEDADAEASRLSCPRCGSWRTDLIAGDELLLRASAGGYMQTRYELSELLIETTP